MKWGLQVAAVFALLAVGARLLGGPATFAKGPSLIGIVAAELICGVIGGLIVGVTLPVLQTTLAVGVVGLVVGTIVGIALRIAQFGYSNWAMRDLFPVLVYPICGVAIAVSASRRIAALKKSKH